MPCALCGKPSTVGAHVRDEYSFEPGQDDRTWNIIPLCRYCHGEFDDHKIGITDDKRSFVVLREDGGLHRVLSKVSMGNIKDEYIDWKNRKCHRKILLRLGLVKGYEQYGELSDLETRSH